MYVQNINGVWQELQGNIVFSSTVYQTAESLTDEQRKQFGVYLIVDVPAPELTREQKLGEPICVVKGDTLERTWPVVEKTNEELQADYDAAAAGIRAERNMLIANTDWTQLDDTQLVNAQKLAWAVYRQALRDVPNQSGFPYSVIWPQEP